MRAINCICPRFWFIVIVIMDTSAAQRVVAHQHSDNECIICAIPQGRALRTCYVVSLGSMGNNLSFLSVHDFHMAKFHLCAFSIAIAATKDTFPAITDDIGVLNPIKPHEPPWNSYEIPISTAAVRFCRAPCRVSRTGCRPLPSGATGSPESDFWWFDQQETVIWDASKKGEWSWDS